MERARREVSLWSRVRSTWYKSEFSGTLMDPPVSGINETPATIVRKERRLVFAGAGEAATRSVRIRAPLLTWPVPDPFDLLGPLHDSREKAITRIEDAKKLLSPHRHIPARGDLRSRFTLLFPLNGKCDLRLVLQQLVEVSV